MALNKITHCLAFAYFVHIPSAADDAQLACINTAAASVKIGLSELHNGTFLVLTSINNVLCCFGARVQFAGGTARY